MKLPVIALSLLLSLSLPQCAAPVSEAPAQTTVDTQPVPETTIPATLPKITGWAEEDGCRYYYDENGIPVTGWQTVDGLRYYFLENGAMATGEVQIEQQLFHFSSQGQRIILVNPWNSIPDDYTPDLVSLGAAYGVEGSLVDSSCYDALVAMITDCNRECPQAIVVSSYRTHEFQTNNYLRKVNYFLGQGLSQEEAEIEAAKIIAIPGTSEHQLGLAVDIVDTRDWSLEEWQADLPAQQWLMENCWRYGFILRYPKDKTDVTGIIYEPWHYRYVGVEIAAELHESGLTLEEYIQSLTR